MTTITTDTLSDKVTIFLRDVLRNNLTDPNSANRGSQEWIWKSTPEGIDFLAPWVIIVDFNETSEPVSVSKTRHSANGIVVSFVVQASSISDRDSVSDELVKILKDPTSADSSGDTIASQNLSYEGYDKSNDDSLKDNSPEFFRIKDIEVNFTYIG